MLLIDFRRHYAQGWLHAGHLVHPTCRCAFVTQGLQLMPGLSEAGLKAFQHESRDQRTDAVFHQPQGECLAKGNAGQLARLAWGPIPAVGRAFVIALQRKDVRQLEQVSLNGTLGGAVAGVFQSRVDIGGGDARSAVGQ
ncbi:hypothetical protein D9M69_683310 [compost metagenome]